MYIDMKQIERELGLMASSKSKFTLRYIVALIPEFLYTSMGFLFLFLSHLSSQKHAVVILETDLLW